MKRKIVPVFGEQEATGE